MQEHKNFRVVHRRQMGRWLRARGRLTVQRQRLAESSSKTLLSITNWVVSSHKKNFIPKCHNKEHPC